MEGRRPAALVRGTRTLRYYAGYRPRRVITPPMNRPFPRTTTAAEGLPRRPFTVAELEQMTAAGILDEDERIELIGGEVVPMSPKGNHHEVVKAALNVHWVKHLPDDLMFVTETTFRFTKTTISSPISCSIRRREA